MTPKQEEQATFFLGVLFDLFHDNGDDRQYIIRDMLDKPNHDFSIDPDPNIYAMLHPISWSTSHPQSRYVVSGITRDTKFVVREINHPSRAFTWLAERRGNELYCDYCNEPRDYFARYKEKADEEFCHSCRKPLKKLQLFFLEIRDGH